MMRTRFLTICFVLILLLSFCSAKGGGGGGRGGSSSSSGSRSSSSSSSSYRGSSSSYSYSSGSGYYSSGGYYYTSGYYRTSSGLSNVGSCDKVCGIAVGSVIGGLAGLFFFTFLIIFGLSFCKDSFSGCCDSCDGCCTSDSGSSSYGGSHSYGGSSSTPDIAMMTEVKVHTAEGEKNIVPVYSNRWMDPECRPESYYNGVYHEAPAEAFAASNEFNRQYPPQNVLPPPDHIQWIVSQGAANAWHFGPDLEATWRVQRKTRAEDNGRFVVFENSEDAMMQTNYPFFCPTQNPSVDTLNETLFYFEGTIVKKPSGSSTIAFGLATKPYPAYRLPGWNQNSVGYHSDDGHKFWNNGYGGEAYGPVYGEGDVIGVGYNPGQGNVFFTKNGKHVGVAFSGKKHVFFPCIGSDGHAEISINFGDNPERPFAYSDANGYGPGGLYKNFPSPSSAIPPAAPSAAEITV
eukprot:TRINITY_DN1515_c0_g1_i1.p1 TRINITY_DN1515_c0_g1~~TRINITY_DN1515_c0_g1_i1.p1  ORF type:complete len:460 (-),score=161.07 TRINITY_DN1515_c0_g1_i1:59-1438(-)